MYCKIGVNLLYSLSYT